MGVLMAGGCQEMATGCANKRTCLSRAENTGGHCPSIETYFPNTPAECSTWLNCGRRPHLSSGYMGEKVHLHGSSWCFWLSKHGPSSRSFSLCWFAPFSKRPLLRRTLTISSPSLYIPRRFPSFSLPTPTLAIKNLYKVEASNRG